MIRKITTTALALISLLGVDTLKAAEITIDFEGLTLAPDSFYNGSDLAGDFSSQGATFNNQFTNYGGGCCWSGWAYSNTIDTNVETSIETPGVNQYSALPGSGANASLQYGVIYDGSGPNAGVQPVIELPIDSEPVSLQVTNTTFAARSMLNGDAFAKEFGGASGDDPDWFQLHIYGRDSNDGLAGELSIYLADYRFTDNSQDFILNEWITVDLSSLQNTGVTKLEFSFSSSDEHPSFGINTPLYAAIDNLVLEQACSDPAPSDFNFDCLVNQQDLAIWKTGYGQFSENNAQPSDGDADGDGDVDGFDLLAWQRAHDLDSLGLQFQTATIPEPTALTQIIVVLMTWSVTRKHRCNFCFSDNFDFSEQEG